MAVTTPEATRPLTTIGMGVFLLSEGMFFLVLILAFLYNRALADPAVLTGGAALEPPRAGLFTACLVASSGTIWLAERRLRSRDRRGAGAWLLTTVGLGLIFLAGQAIEYAGLLGRGVTIASNLFGTQFYTLTGLHFLHVSAGVVMLAILAGLALRGRADEPAAGAVEPIALYWHFVDAVWIVLFAVIYLLGA
jgi:heme/copper-type cytochrome/quinol oxidase subunit 3